MVKIALLGVSKHPNTRFNFSFIFSNSALINSYLYYFIKIISTLYKKKPTKSGAVPTSSSLLSYGSSESCRSTLPPSMRTALTNGILVLNSAALTAIDTASHKLPPHSSIWKCQQLKLHHHITIKHWQY